MQLVFIILPNICRKVGDRGVDGGKEKYYIYTIFIYPKGGNPYERRMYPRLLHMRGKLRQP